MNPHPHFDEAERKAVYRVIAERRDVRRGFLDPPVADDLVGRLLTAAHSAPSVGLMQPSRFIVIRDYGIRKGVHRIFEAAKRRALDCYAGAQAERYSVLKLEGILEAPQDLRVLCDPGSERLDAADSQGDDHRHESDGHVVVKLSNRFHEGPPYAPSIRILSVVSINDMPAAKSVGNAMIDHRDRPLDASATEMPSTTI